jgi:hypothetical protein
MATVLLGSFSRAKFDRTRFVKYRQKKIPTEIWKKISST